MSQEMLRQWGGTRQSRRKHSHSDAIRKCQVYENLNFSGCANYIFLTAPTWEEQFEKKTTLQLSQPCDIHLQQVQQASANDSQVPALQGMGVVHSRKLKQERVSNVTAREMKPHKKCKCLMRAKLCRSSQHGRGICVFNSFTNYYLKFTTGKCKKRA